MPERLRCLRCTTRSDATSLSSRLSSTRRLSIRLLSSSSLVSPAPRLDMEPEVPPCLVSASYMPVSLGLRYSRLASSTCSLASLERARFLNISSISIVLSITGVSVSSCRFLSCDGVSVSLNTISPTSRLCARSLISITLPGPK